MLYETRGARRVPAVGRVLGAGIRAVRAKYIPHSARTSTGSPYEPREFRYHCPHCGMVHRKLIIQPESIRCGRIQIQVGCHVHGAQHIVLDMVESGYNAWPESAAALAHAGRTTKPENTQEAERD
jgi:hypothetical protein